MEKRVVFWASCIAGILNEVTLHCFDHSDKVPINLVIIDRPGTPKFYFNKATVG